MFIYFIDTALNFLTRLPSYNKRKRKKKGIDKKPPCNDDAYAKSAKRQKRMKTPRLRRTISSSTVRKKPSLTTLLYSPTLIRHRPHNPRNHHSPGIRRRTLIIPRLLTRRARTPRSSILSDTQIPFITIWRYRAEHQCTRRVCA
jgi:hypothetical protein